MTRGGQRLSVRSGPTLTSKKLECDVAVIGAGHNGLIAANYLAQAGLETLVLEANPVVGGMTCSGSPPEAPDHVFNLCAMDLLFWNCQRPSKDLQLEKHGLRTVTADPVYAYLDPDGQSIAFWRDPRRTADEIRYFSRADAESYLRLADLLDHVWDLAGPLQDANPARLLTHPGLARVTLRAIRGRKLLGEMAYLPLATGREIVHERFGHPIVRDALRHFTAAIETDSRPGTALGLLFLPVIHRYPCVRVVGGTQGLPTALTARLATVGGSVATDALVTEIRVHRGRADGLVLVDGTEIEARKAILSTCQPQVTLTQLLPAGTLSPLMEARAKEIPTRQSGNGFLKIDVALSGRLDLSRHNRFRRDGLDLRLPSHHIGTAEELDRGFSRATAGLIPEERDWGFWNTIPTALDPSQAPNGQDTLYLYVTTAPNQPVEGWESVKEKAAQSMMNKAALYYGGLFDLELVRKVETVDMLAERMNLPGGNIIHVDWALNRFGPLRPARGLGGYATPVDGLFLGGAGSHPGGSVTGGPGRNAAMEILRSLRRSRRRKIWSGRGTT